MKEGFKFIPPNMFIGMYGGIKKKGEEIEKPKESETKKITFIAFGADDPDQANPDCLVFVKNTKFFSGKFKTNPINYVFPFFPLYIEYMLQAAPYFFIHEEYLEKLEKYQPIYDIDSAFKFLEEKGLLTINSMNKVVTLLSLKDFVDEKGMLILPIDEVKRVKSNHTFSTEAKKSNQRQYEVAIDGELNKKYDMDKLANTLGYCMKEKTNYVRNKPLEVDEGVNFKNVKYDLQSNM